VTPSTPWHAEARPPRDKTIIAAVAKEPAQRDSAAEQRIRDRLAGIAAERNGLQQIFAKEFPDYAALSNPMPLTGKEVQANRDGSMLTPSLRGAPAPRYRGFPQGHPRA
jgi:hypothetical protein